MITLEQINDDYFKNYKSFCDKNNIVLAKSNFCPIYNDYVSIFICWGCSHIVELKKDILRYKQLTLNF